jgi:hypothetical protein
VPLSDPNPPDLRGRRWPRELIEQLARLDTAALGHFPAQACWRARHDRPHPDTAVHRYGSWAAFAAAIGEQPLPPYRPSVWTLARMQELVRLDAERLDRPPRYEDWRHRSDRPGYSAIARHAGSWRALLASVGMECARPGCIAHRTAVPSEVLREAFERSGRTLSEVARNAGWVRCRGKHWQADTRRLRRALYRQERMHAATAERLAAAIGVDPYEVGV